MAIHNTIFNFAINQGDSRSITYAVDVATASNNVEYRNAFTRNGRNIFTIDLKGRSDTEAKEIMAFYKARHGKLYAFLFKDYFDYQISKEQGYVGFTGLSNGYTQTYDLNMFYDEYDNVGKRIYKPDLSSFKLYIDNVLQASNTFTLDSVNGKVIFNSLETRTIASITKGTSTTITFTQNHTYNVNDKLVISNLTSAFSSLQYVTVFSKTANSISVQVNTSTITEVYVANSATSSKYIQDGKLLRYESNYYKVVRFNNDDLTSSYASFNKNDFDAIELIECINEY